MPRLLEQERTGTVSGRVSERSKRLVSRTLAKRGITASDVISNTWDYIAATGDVPEYAATPYRSDRAEALDAIKRLRAEAPLDTPLSTMTSSDLKKELSDRA